MKTRHESHTIPRVLTLYHHTTPSHCTIKFTCRKTRAIALSVLSAKSRKNDTNILLSLGVTYKTSPFRYETEQGCRDSDVPLTRVRSALRMGPPMTCLFRRLMVSRNSSGSATFSQSNSMAMSKPVSGEVTIPGNSSSRRSAEPNL